MKSNLRLRLSADARADLRDIRRYTTQRWGARQRDISDAQLTDALHALLDYPELGPTRDDLFVGCRNLLVAQDVIYYRLSDDVIIAARVLHRSQNPYGKVNP